MERKILPISTPPITSYPAHTANLTVAGTHKDFKEWLFTNNLILMISNDITQNTNRYSMLETFPFGCPLLTRINVPNSIGPASLDIVATIKHYIDCSMYVMVEIDQYHISSSSSFQKQHSWQPILIYGYSDLEKEFYVNGFFDNSKYKSIIATYDDIYAATTHYSEVESEKYKPNKSTLCLLSPRDEYTYTYSLKRFLEMLSDHYNSSPPKEYLFHEILDIRNVCEFTFGIKVYDCISTYLSNLGGNYSDCDVRLFHVLYEHNLLWRKRIEYMLENNIIIPQVYEYCMSIVNEMVLLSEYQKNMAIRYNLVLARTILETIGSTNKQLKQLDMKLSAYLLKNLTLDATQCC